MDAANIYTVENFIKGVEALTNIKVEQKDDILVLKRRIYLSDRAKLRYEIVGEIPLDEITDLCDAVRQNKYTFENSALYSDTSYEAAVRKQGSSFVPVPRDDRAESSDNKYSFTLSQASPEYFLSHIFHIAINNDKAGDRIIGRPRSNISSFEEFRDECRILTAKVNSPKQHSPADYRRMLDSYIFNLSYKFDVSLSIADDLKELWQRIVLMPQRSGQLFPYKSYNPELTSYYYQAVAASFSSTKYLDFYHVIEYFFQSISKDEAYEEIQNAITHPSFSPHSKEDVGDFYEIIREKMQKQHEDGVWKEKPALLLCLKKYVPDLGTLKKLIEDIDADAVPYYQTTAVPFVDGGTTIDFAADKDKVYKSIRDRVYSVRNAIVHSKEGSMRRYEPFKHNEYLAKEIPLIRAIAEECIIQSAEPINYHTEE